MPTQTRATLKGYFTKGNIPTENNFADLIDSTLVQIDDGLLTSATAPLSIKAVGADEGLINFYRVESGQNPNTTTWQIKHLPVGSSTPGLSIGTPAGTRLFIDNTTGNLGIGTVTPGFPLTVGNNNLGDKISLWGQSGNHYGFGIQGSQLQIHTAGASDDVVFGYGNSGSMTETMRIKGNGNLGIGTGTPAEKLDVSGNIKFNNILSTPGRMHITGEELLFLLHKQGVIIGKEWGGNGNLTVEGNVGIGTQTPGFPLTIGNNTLGDKISLWGQSGDNYGFGIQGALLQIHTAGATDDVVFGYGSSGSMTETMRIKGNGNVGVGTANPQAKLDVKGAIRAGNSDIYFTETNHNHSGIGNSTGYAAIENAASHGALMILGRNTATSPNINRVVKVWDYLQVNGGLDVTGRVGIGTTTPVAPLQVSGGAALGSFFLGAKVWPDVTGDDNNPNFNAASAAWGGTTHSIVSDLRIRASALDVTNISNASDARTKRIVGRASGEKDLLTMMEIEVTDFTFIDTATNGGAPQKKVIAQQLEKVFPQAATRATGVVPDLFQRADIRDGWIDLATDLKAGERVRLIGELESGVFEVLEVQPDRFRTGFRPEGEKVFVYGREVKDFGSVDYDAIAMLNVSATQELARRVEAQAANVFACSEKISTLEQRLAGIEAPVYEAVSHA